MLEYKSVKNVISYLVTFFRKILFNFSTLAT